MELRPVGIGDALVAPLLADLAEEYRVRYGAVDEMSSVPDEDFDPPAGLFLAAVEGGRIVAGGGFHYLAPGVCEVKRMWTRADQRRRGHASAVLGALEDGARGAGYTRVRLETGPAQPEAAALYEHLGYRRIPVFGRYAHAIAFEREL